MQSYRGFIESGEIMVTHQTNRALRSWSFVTSKNEIFTQYS